MKRILLGLFIATLAFAPSANATVVFGDGGAALQNVFDNITTGPVAGSSSINVATDQLGFDKHWAITGSGGSIATIIIELAGYAGTNTFGVYDATNPAAMVQIFGGAAGTGSQAVLSIMLDGSVFVNFVDTGVNFAGNAFGFYLGVPAASSTFFSDTALNGDGLDHMAAYRGKNIDTIQIGALAPGLWTDNEFALAWEDLPGGGDGDFDDFVVMVESALPVPEPTSLLLIGLGMVGMGAARWRRR